jgi:hypothetical protein
MRAFRKLSVADPVIVHEELKVEHGRLTSRLQHQLWRYYPQMLEFSDDLGANWFLEGLNRKNALFAGHDQRVENWACIASLIGTCKLHGVDPQTYFTDVLTKLVNLWAASRLDELMPWTWATERSTNKLAA